MLSQSPEECMKSLQKGRVFTEHTNFDKKILLLFYSKTPKGGALYWCAPERPKKSPDAMLDLADLVAIHVGRQEDYDSYKVTLIHPNSP